jgi:cobalt-zinc-cadmium efflux system membrane fusion protein
MKLSTSSPHWLAGLAVVVFLVGASVVSVGAQDNHDGHDHAAETEQDNHAGHDHGDEPDAHAGHDHEEVGNDDDHGDHDGHDHGAEAKADTHAGHDHGDDEENGAIRISPSVMAEYSITVETATARALAQTIRLPGEVVFNSDRIAHVTPSVAGVVQGVNQTVGDRVETGDVMAVLSSRELAGARSAFLGSQASLELEQEILDREQTMLDDRIGTATAVLEARKAVREQQIALNLAEQNLHALGQSQAEVDALSGSADTVLSQYQLKAPLSGIVIAREITRGEVISEQPDEAPFVIADLSSVWVNLTVYQRDLANVRAGLPVQVRFGHGIPDARGTIGFVSPAVDEQTRTATARIVLDNPQGVWRPGLFVTGIVETSDDNGEAAPQSARVVVPKAALQTVDEGRVVFVQTPEGFEPRPVEIGQTTDTHAQIVSGLEAGERYVAANAFALKAELNRAALEHAGHVH